MLSPACRAVYPDGPLREALSAKVRVGRSEQMPPAMQASLPGLGTSLGFPTSTQQGRAVLGSSASGRRQTGNTWYHTLGRGIALAFPLEIPGA